VTTDASAGPVGRVTRRLLADGETAVGLYRKLPSGRSSRVQVLSEGDVIGLHDLADPKQPSYVVRTLTPVTLLTLDRSAVEAIAIPRIARTTLTDTILKLPFLRRISLCQNWHFQAIERFADLSSITDYASGGVIFPENEFNENFFIIFEQDALVSRNGRRLATIHAGDFFGEIGLLQNSASNAQVSAKQDMRCLSISRVEFLRFVTHNNTVALELEPLGIRARIVIPGRAPETPFGENARGRMGLNIPDAYQALAAQMFARFGAGGDVTYSRDVSEAVWRAATDPT